MATEPKPQHQPETATPPPQRMTFEEFLDWMDEDTLAEWVDGEVVMTSPASTRHQDILGFLFEVLRGYSRWKKLGRVSVGPSVVKLPTSAREPDISYVSTPHLTRLGPNYLNGPADLVMEIVSPESIDRDYRVKFAEYEAAGIPEYWLIDPEANRVLLYRLGPDGHYVSVAPQNRRLHSSILPGFWLDPSWLAQDPLPDEDATLREIGGEPYRQYLLGQGSH